MAKRGRKPKDKSANSKFYFLEREEQAVVDYIKYYKVITNATKEILTISFGCQHDQLDTICSGKSLYEMIELANDIMIDEDYKKNSIRELKEKIEYARAQNEKIYNDILKPAFTIMVESLMRSMGLFVPNENFTDTFNDAISFMLTKMERFDPSKGTKAYSYMGTLCKHYLMSRRQLYQKSLIRNPSYDANEDDYKNDSRFLVIPDNGKAIASETMQSMINKLKDMVNKSNQYGLKENEVKVGNAIINLFENWDYVLTTDGSDKLNKNAILLFLREQTGLDTKGVRDNMKKYKKEYILVKNAVIN